MNSSMVSYKKHYNQYNSQQLNNLNIIKLLFIFIKQYL